MTTEEIHLKGYKTIDDQIENGNIVMFRYKGEMEDWNRLKWKEYKTGKYENNN